MLSRITYTFHRILPLLLTIAVAEHSFLPLSRLSLNRGLVLATDRRTRLPAKRVTRDPIKLILGRLHGQDRRASTLISSFFPLPFVRFLLSPTVIHIPSLAFRVWTSEKRGWPELNTRLIGPHDCPWPAIVFWRTSKSRSSRNGRNREEIWGKEWRSFSYVLSLGTLLKPGSWRVSSGINAR